MSGSSYPFVRFSQIGHWTKNASLLCQGKRDCCPIRYSRGWAPQSQGPVTTARSMSGGNQQKAIIAREVDRNKPLIVAVQPTRGLDVGAIENVHKELVKQRDAGKAVLLVSLELDEVMSLSDRILVMYEGEIVGEFDPKQITVQELGLYMAGAKRADKKEGETA